MKKGIIQAVLVVAVAGIVIYLAQKKIVKKNKRIIREKKENEFVSRHRRKFSDAYGEYTL